MRACDSGPKLIVAPGAHPLLVASHRLSAALLPLLAAAARARVVQAELRGLAALRHALRAAAARHLQRELPRDGADEVREVRPVRDAALAREELEVRGDEARRLGAD